jgi:Cytochrome P460
MNLFIARTPIMGLLLVGVITVAGGGRSLAANPCAAKNPCAANPAAMKDPVAEATFKEYRAWKKVNTQPVLSASHGNRYVFTYLNKAAEPSGLLGIFPFSKGAVLATESFEAKDGKPGPQGPLFIMEKRGEGYDRGHANWHYAVVDPRGAVSLSGSGHERSPTRFCSACHAMAKANDYVFGNGRS